MNLGQTESNSKPNAATALRWLDRNASHLKYGLTLKDQQEFDAAVTALWELFLNGRGSNGAQ